MQRDFVGDVAKISEIKNRTIYQFYSDLDYKRRQNLKTDEVSNRVSSKGRRT